MLKRINFRDFGGKITASGQKIRSGILYRSGVWQKMNDHDKAHIISLDIQYVVDFRSIEEQEKTPALLPGKARVSMPCNIDRITRDRLRPLLFKPHANEKIIDVIDGVYVEMVDMMAKPMGNLVSLMLTPGAFPIIIHCRAGKDRTGFAAAMIQLFLGLDQESIIEEYLRSNEFLMPKISRVLKQARLFTFGLFPKTNLQAAFEVKERYLLTAINRVNQHYGGVENYLLSGGTTSEQLGRLKTLLLEL
jgi:protein-tyrosine phosphatase